MTNVKSVAQKLTIEDIAGRLDHAKRLSDGTWSARCPAHEDRMPSLSLTERSGKILIHCHAGCETGDILAAIGLRWVDLFADSDEWAASEAAAVSLAAHKLRRTWQISPIDFERRIIEIAIAQGELSVEDRVRVELAVHRLGGQANG